MATQTPLLLLDNILDTIIQYPNASLLASSESVGREALHVADYRRERSWWQPTTSVANHYVGVDLGVGNSGNADSLWLDRGHNLAGIAVSVDYSDNGSSWTSLVSRTVPAVGATVGGDPTTGFALTEEGACWTLFAAAGGAHRYWRVSIATAGIWQIPGIILGSRTQLISFSASYDDDEGDRLIRSEQSDAGYLATSPPYTYRRCTLDLAVIGDTEYDGKLRQCRQLLFQFNCPSFVCLNYGVRPERAWLFAFDGPKWAMGKHGVYRAGKIPMREVGAVVGGLVVPQASGGATSPYPPDAQGNLVLVFDPLVDGTTQTGTPLIGPNYQLGSTSGSDTNDPTRTAGPPAFFTYGADDYITFFDNLASMFANAAGFTIIACINPSAGDIAADLRRILHKDDIASQRSVMFKLTSGAPTLDAFYTLTATQYTSYQATAAVTAARHRVTASYDPAAARASRAKFAVDGSVVAQNAANQTGADGTVTTGTAELRIGYDASATRPAPAIVGAIYVYNRPLTNTELANNDAWLAARGWT